MGKHIINRLAAALWCAAVLFAPLCAQDAPAAEEPAAAETPAAEAAPENPEESIILNLGGNTDSPAPPVTAAPSLAGLFTRMIVALALVALCIYALMRFFKRGMTNAFTDDPYLKKTASLTLAPGKTVHVVTLDDSAFLVGVADNSVNLLGKIENKELVDAMNLYAKEEAPRRNTRRGPVDFSRLLGILTGKRQKKTFAQTLDETADIIRGQRSRIRGANEDEQ